MVRAVFQSKQCSNGQQAELSALGPNPKCYCKRFILFIPASRVIHRPNRGASAVAVGSTPFA